MNVEEKQRFAALARAVAERRDQEAFAVLFDYFAPRLKSWLLRQRMASGEAEELVQEIMVVLWHKGELYDAGDRLFPLGFFASPATAGLIFSAGRERGHWMRQTRHCSRLPKVAQTRSSQMTIATRAYAPPSVSSQRSNGKCSAQHSFSANPIHRSPRRRACRSAP